MMPRAEKFIDIQKLVRPNIAALTPYSSARSLFTSGVLMDANENPYNLFHDEIELNRYPDSSNRALREAAAALFGVSPEECAVGSGSDELLDLLFRIFCEPKQDEALISNPTYGNYEVLAAIHDARVIDVPLAPGFRLDTGRISQHLTTRTKLIFICSPNNPTGNAFRREDILSIVAEANAIVVLDEAYAEFSTEPSLIPEIRRWNNLVILRTLSKAYAFAGGRIGFAIANPEIIRYIQKIKLPYNLSILAAERAVKAMENQALVRERIKTIVEAREKLAAELRTVPGVQEIFPSQANFILFRIAGATKVFEKLAGRGVIVRNRSTVPQLENCLRVTVGDEKQNHLLMQHLKEIAAETC